jgi:hypothetical protein
MRRAELEPQVDRREGVKARRGGHLPADAEAGVEPGRPSERGCQSDPGEAPGHALVAQAEAAERQRRSDVAGLGTAIRRAQERERWVHAV